MVPSMIAVVFSEGPRAGERVELDREVTIGRADCDVTLDDREVSRRHLALRPAGPELDVEDLGSTNGTLVDGRRIAGAVRVGDGSVIRLGTSELIVKLTVTPEPEAAAAGVTATGAVAAAPVATAASGGLPRWFWTVTALVEVAVILTALVVLVYYAV
jgi:pSer/pThr/pTyr-binding forkhead associated (FHA) protein